MSVQDRIHSFLASGPFAVVGASTDRSKYGNKVLRCYQQHGHEVYPINPKAPEVEGLKAQAEALAGEREALLRQREIAARVVFRVGRPGRTERGERRAVQR